MKLCALSERPSIRERQNRIDLLIVIILLFLIAINYSTTVRSNIDAAIFLRVACDMEDKPILMLVIIDSHPGSGNIIGTEKASHAIYSSNEVKRRIGAARFWCAEAEGMYLTDVAHRSELSIRHDMIQAVKGSNPQIIFSVRS